MNEQTQKAVAELRAQISKPELSNEAYLALDNLITAFTAELELLADDKRRLAQSEQCMLENYQVMEKQLEAAQRENEELLDDAKSESVLKAQQLAKLEHERDQAQAKLRHAKAVVEMIWHDDEMGYIIDGQTRECVKCGQKAETGKPIQHDPDCMQSPMEKVLYET